MVPAATRNSRPTACPILKGRPVMPAESHKAKVTQVLLPTARSCPRGRARGRWWGLGLSHKSQVLCYWAMGKCQAVHTLEEWEGAWHGPGCGVICLNGGRKGNFSTSWVFMLFKGRRSHRSPSSMSCSSPAGPGGAWSSQSSRPRLY